MSEPSSVGTTVPPSVSAHRFLGWRSWVSVRSYRKWLQLRTGPPGTLCELFLIIYVKSILTLLLAWTHRDAICASVFIYKCWVFHLITAPCRIIMVAFFVIRIPYTFPDALQIKLIRSEYYNFRIPLNKLFLWLHLITVLPSGLLAVFQFVPGIRARAMSYHRTVGKIINISAFVSTACACGMARVSFGGDLAIQAGTYLVGAMILWSTAASWRAIRRLQIDEHRIWLIRAWSYQMCIMTLRLCSFAGIVGISFAGGFYQVSEYVLIPSPSRLIV